MFDRLTLSHLLNANVVNLSDTFSVLIREPSLKSILEIEEYLTSTSVINLFLLKSIFGTPI